MFLSSMGRHAEAIAQGARAAELDPLSLLIGDERAEIYHLARDHGRAIEECQRLIEIEPTYVRAYEVLGWIYIALGDYAQAIEAVQVAEDLKADEVANLRAAYEDQGKDGYWRWHLARLEARRSKAYVAPDYFYRAYAALEQADAAFAALDEAFEMRDGQLAFLKVDPFFDPIRGDPRFADLLRRMNFPGDQDSHAGP
jgi:tetratricopeptide (TPR) repeat protein